MRDQKNTQPFSEFGTYFLSEYAGTPLLMYGIGIIGINISNSLYCNSSNLRTRVQYRPNLLMNTL